MNTIGKEFSKLGVAAKQKKAAERFRKVRELRKQGLSAPRILEILNADGADWKIRTIYEDFKKIKQVEAKATQKYERALEQVNKMKSDNRPIAQIIAVLNARGFEIDAKKVTHYDRLKQEIEKSINADIHDIL